jgi:hypothetical protein
VRPRDVLWFLGALAAIAAPMVVFQALHFDEIQTRFRAISVFREEHPLAALGHAYVAHLDPRFLFLAGDANPRQGWAGWGELLLATAPFAALGLLRSLGRREAGDLLLLAWLLIYPLGAALTSEGIPHASRSFLGAPLFAILAAQGAALCIERVLSRNGKVVLAVLLVAGLLANAGLALRFYFLEYPRVAAGAWTAGVERLIPELVAHRGAIKHVHFMPGPAGGVAIVREHVLFLTKFDPTFDPARADGFFQWNPEVVSWARFLKSLPKDEAIVAWPERRGGHQWGRPPWLRVRDENGEVAFDVYRGFGQ